MRPRVLAASMSLVLILSGRVVVQTIQNRPPDHDHPAVGLPGVRQLALKPFTTLPKGVLFLRLENFSTTKAAEDAATSASAVVEWAGKIWLFTLGPMGVRSSGGTLVVEIGPVPDVPAAASYVLDVNEADFGPEMKAQVAQQVHKRTRVRRSFTFLPANSASKLRTERHEREPAKAWSLPHLRRCNSTSWVHRSAMLSSSSFTTLRNRG